MWDLVRAHGRYLMRGIRRNIKKSAQNPTITVVSDSCAACYSCSGRVFHFKARTAMARSDLLVSLVRASAAGDRSTIASTVEAIVLRNARAAITFWRTDFNGRCNPFLLLLPTRCLGLNLAGAISSLSRSRD